MVDKKTLAKNTVFKSEHFQVVRLELEEKGKKFSKDVIERENVVLVLPIDRDGDIYLVEQYREALQKTTLELASGLFDAKFDKTTLDAAKRELKEETGFTAKDWKHVATFNLAPSIVQKIDLFVAQNLEKGEQNFDFDEDITLRKLKLEDAVGLALSGKIELVYYAAAILLVDKIKKINE